MKKTFRGLSPLLASLLLLVFTLVGAFFVYEYFNKTVDLATKQSESLMVVAREHKVSGSTKLITLEIVNAHSSDAVIKEVREYLETGEVRKVKLLSEDQSTLSVSPGSKTSFVVIASVNARALVIVYEVGGTVLERSVALTG
ncbi:MAG: archaellin/type IV pilin N-terminal domain-containing protein [Acidilobaceae archaeon]